MIDFNLLIIAAIALLAFLVKGTTGFGPSIVIVSLGALFLPPHTVVVLSALLTVPAGMIMLWSDPIKGSCKFWVPLGAALAVGSIIGGL